MGRGIEQALLNYVAKQAEAAGIATLHGRFIPTGKNAPAADFYSRMGFDRVEAAEPNHDGEQGWTVAPSTVSGREAPRWLTLIAEGEKTHGN